MPSARAVGFGIVAHLGIGRNADVLVKNRAAQLRPAADVAVVHDHAAFHYSPGMHADAASQDRFADQAAGKNASTRDDAVQSLAAAPLFIENELCRRIRIARASYWPLAVVEIEVRFDVIQIHIGFVIGINGADVPPIGARISNLTGDAVGLEVVSVDWGFAGESGQDVAAEIVMAVSLFGVLVQQV